MKEWISITATKEHIDAIAKMAETHYGSKDDTAQAEYLLYEYFNNPDGDAIAQIAWNEKKHEVCGQETLIPKKIKVANYELKALMSVNTITMEEYRGQGIFTTLGQDALTQANIKGDYQITLGMPNQNSYHGFVTKLGFKDIGSLPLYLRPLKVSMIAKKYLHQNWLSYLLKPADYLTSYSNKSQQNKTEFVRLTKENLYLADEFWKKIKDKYPIMVSLNSQYIKYRFIDIPRRKYEIWYAIKNGKPVAFVIGRVMEVAEMQCGMVANFLFLNDYEKEAKALLKHVLYILQEQGAILAGCLMQSFADEAKILRKFGFFVCPKALEPQPFPFIINVSDKNPNLHMTMDFKNWFFTMGDYDIV